MSPENKIHLYFAESPLRDYERKGLKALCGYKFLHAIDCWNFRQEFEPMVNWRKALDVLSVCRICREITLADDREGKVYFYALAEAESRFAQEVECTEPEPEATTAQPRNANLIKNERKQLRDTRTDLNRKYL